MKTIPLLYPEHTYHLYNRGNNSQQVFFTDSDYRLFLERCPRFLEPIAEIFAYCLLPNHFHLLVRLRPAAELWPILEKKDKVLKEHMRTMPDFLSDQISNWFNSFAKTMNHRHNRNGNLFKRPFQRKEIGDELQLLQTIRYIHKNPQRHRLTEDFRTWRFSSYTSFFSGKPTRLRREEVLEWFGGMDLFRAFHEGQQEEDSIMLEDSMV